MAKTTITDLLEAGVHFGHQTRRWNPKMKPYIYGTRSGITIFDLGKTMRQLAAACDFLTETATNGGQILFVGAKRQAQECVRTTAERLNMPFMCERWLGGTLTNQNVVLKRVAYLKKLKEQEANGSMAALPKKEVAGLRREMGKLDSALGGIVNMYKLPAALVDSCCNPDQIDYVIPGNDDALRSIKVIVDALATAVEAGLGVASKKRSDKNEALSEASVGKEDAAEEVEKD